MIISPNSLKSQKLGIHVSGITAFIIFLLFIIYLVIQVIKNFQLSNLNKALSERDFELVDKLVSMAVSRKLLGEYTCDLYQLRALYSAKNVLCFEEKLQNMIAKAYKNHADKKSFLEQYFHVFLLKDNQKYTAWLLDGIRATGDEPLIRYHEQAYEVIFHRRTDLIETMDAQIDGKQYYGFSLGVILFMIAKQYEYLNQNEKAMVYYENAKICFPPKAIYLPVIENLIMCLKTDK